MKAPDRFSSSQFPAGMHIRPEPLIRVSEIISALSYALDLTEGRPMGHSVRACMIGMRLAAQTGLPANEQADLYYALLLKDAGCSSNSSRLFHILNADDIRAKRDVKTTDWTRVGWESLHYALTHVATGVPFLQRMQRLFQVAATQQQDSCDLVKIRCERGASHRQAVRIFRQRSHRHSQIWTSTGTAADIRTAAAERDSRLLPHRQSGANTGGVLSPLAGRKRPSKRRPHRSGPLV